MKKLLSAALLLLVLAATAANVNVVRKRSVVMNDNATIQDSVVISGNTLTLDTIQLPLNKIPTAQDLYSVAKVSVGRWAKLFTVIKIEESGADGKNSYLARKYNNLTGMRWPNSGRKTTAVGKSSNLYAIFNNWHDCMLDWSYYISAMDASFQEKYGREAKDENEMVDYMFGSYNPHSVWRHDVKWLLRHFHYK